jgi:hypothetical protein
MRRKQGSLCRRSIKRTEAEAKIAARKEEEEKTGKKPRGREPQNPAPDAAQPEAKAQRNFTGSESRIMPDGGNKGSFVQGCNAQIAVDSTAQVIVAADITQQANDSQQLIPMLEQVVTNMGRDPEAVSADAGYWSEANATDAAVAEIDLHISTGHIKHGEVIETTSGPPPEQATARQAMHHKLRTEAGRAVYKMRKAIVEPVFGQIKDIRGFRRFSMRGQEKARAEWKLVCATANILKLFRYGQAPQIA